jgi:hydroxymethylpyrimidine kinase/phosphomethylpyrimidine kinase
MTSIALTIAGSDSGGGAGIQADLKTFEAHRVFGTCAITAITAQNTSRVESVFPLPVEIVLAQIKAVLSDMPVQAVKTGMLHSAEIIHAVSEILKNSALPVVVDPVMIATSGDSLLQDEAIASFHSQLLPVATIVTPNLYEAGILSGTTLLEKADMVAAAKIIADRHPHLYVLVKGGHLASPNQELCSDYLYFQGAGEWIDGPMIDTVNTHGTGCTLSAAIAANISLGHSVTESVRLAKSYLTRALTLAWENTGKGRGSLRHNLNLTLTS